ncbi:MAG: hypothetical protein HY430_01120 [Candidatus Levybacteria bacterium]|nr:hypothetical protein [Candidatus Levybacteria bacterium]
MTNAEISKLFRHVAAAYAVKDEKKHYFQIVAYQRAADIIEASPAEMRDLFKEGKLQTVPGIGPSIKTHLEELITTGKVKHFDQVMNAVPQAMFPLLDIPSFGPKKAFKLVTIFHLQNQESVIEDIEKLALDNKIAQLEGFGEKSQNDILQAISEYKTGTTKSARMVLPFAAELADQMITYMKLCAKVNTIYPLGSLRRMVATIGDVDLAVASGDPKAVIEHFTAYPNKERVIEQGPATASILMSGGKHVDLMVQPPDRFGSLLQHFTGSKQHNIHLREVALKKNLSLSEYGIKEKGSEEKGKFDTEEKFYRALGMVWIPPEIREDTGEIELALKNNLPNLVELEDIQGDFHIHSNFAIEPSHDLGRNTIEEMVQKALKLKYTSIGFSEHNPSVSKHSSKETYDLVAQRNEALEKVQQKFKKIKIFKLMETDILANGKIGLDEKSLSILDATIVSIHSSFGMSKNEMTKRVIAGLSHPKAKILAHPTGRLLNQRPGYELDWDILFPFCKEHNKALEINAFPARLDLPDSLVRKAVEYGIKFFINTDSHAAAHMDLMRFGVSVARRGWATKHDILNAMEYNKLEQWFKQ